MHTSPLHPTSPIERPVALLRALSAALETPGLLGWLLGPLFRLLLRRRLAAFEQAFAELAALAGRVADGSYRPEPEEPRPRETRARPPRSGQPPRQHGRLAGPPPAAQPRGPRPALAQPSRVPPPDPENPGRWRRRRTALAPAMPAASRPHPAHPAAKRFQLKTS